MGNEHSKNKELTKNGKVPGKHSNGSVNGLSANITSNGMEIAFNGESLVEQHDEPLSLNLATESTDFVVVESDSKPADAPVISEILETIIQTEEVKESNEDQTNVSLPATEPHPESTSRGEEEATTIIITEDFEYPCRKAESATQTDTKTEADISTQTGKDDDDDDDDDTTTSTEGAVELVFVMETAATEEEPLNGSAFVSAQEAAEETLDEEPLDNQTAGIINADVVMENIAYENMVFRAEPVEVIDIKNYDVEEESMHGREEAEPETAAEPESDPKEPTIEDEIVAEDNIEELEVLSSLPKVVADCVEMVFAAVTPEDHEANGVPCPDEEPATTVMETIPEVICEEPNPTPANQDMPHEERPVPLLTVPLVKVESAHEEVDADDAAAVKDEPETPEVQDEPSEKCEEEMITVEAPSNKLTVEEPPDDEVKPESIPEAGTTDVNAEVGDEAIADVGPERAEEADPSSVLIKDDAEVIPEAAIDALSQELEFCAIIAHEPEVEILLEEEVIVTFVPLSGASLAILEELVETVAEEMDATEALSNETEAVPESVEEDTSNTVEQPAGEPPMNATEESDEPCVSVQEELVEEDVATAEESSDSNHVISEEPAEERASLVDRQSKNDMLVVILETTEQELTVIEEMTDNSGGVLATIEEDSEDSQIATSDVSVSECVEAVLETIVEEIITEDVVAAECNVTSEEEEEAPDVIAEGETEENESSVNSIDSTPSVSSTDMEALVVELQSACISVVEESVYRLGGLTLSSQGYSITVTIDVAPKEQLNY